MGFEDYLSVEIPHERLSFLYLAVAAASLSGGDYTMGVHKTACTSAARNFLLEIGLYSV